MSAVDRDLIASACEAIGQGVNVTTLTRAIELINQRSAGNSNFHDLWNTVLLGMGVTDLFIQVSYRRALSHYYLGRKASQSKTKTKPMATEIHWDSVKVKINDFVSIEFRALKRNGTIKDGDLTQECKIWHKNVRIPISPQEYSKALKVARAAVNKLRR